MGASLFFFFISEPVSGLPREKNCATASDWLADTRSAHNCHKPGRFYCEHFFLVTVLLRFLKTNCIMTSHLQVRTCKSVVTIRFEDTNCTMQQTTSALREHDAYIKTLVVQRTPTTAVAHRREYSIGGWWLQRSYW